MTIVEKSSNRKKVAILELVKNGEYSVAYALNRVEELHDNNKLTDTDYEEVATYLENLISEETEEKNMEEKDNGISSNDNSSIDNSNDNDC